MLLPTEETRLASVRQVHRAHMRHTSRVASHLGKLTPSDLDLALTCFRVGARARSELRARTCRYRDGLDRSEPEWLCATQ